MDLRAPALYINRELSWLEYNARILAEAESEEVPLLERLKFHAIFASNLDEFFMVRVAGLKQQLAGEVEELPSDGMSALDQLIAIAERAHDLAAAQSRALYDHLFPKLAEHGISLSEADSLKPDAHASLDRTFEEELFPILTPIAIDPGHPFPHLRNKSLNLGVMFAPQREREASFGVVQLPLTFPRLIEVAKGTFVLLEDVIAKHIHKIFPSAEISGVYTFRVTRNFDIAIDEDEADDLLNTIQQELRRRDRGAAVRLEIGGSATSASVDKLVHALKLDPVRDVYRTDGMLNVADLANLSARMDRHLRDEPFTPAVPVALREADDPFSVIREGDVLLHHPYDSFDAVVELLSRAAEDPAVLAIKQTLYRTDRDSPILRALARAAESGKQVTALVELKARFDEESNIVWARTLEQSGVHVVYGLLGLKTHAKCLLILRREKDGLRRYVHIGTGNYNLASARVYTDVSLLTADPAIGEDAASLFNLLTGYASPKGWNAFMVAPLGLKEAIIKLIDGEAESAVARKPSGIIAKMNAVVDRDVIEALYRASIAGVPITLLARGICCLRPRMKGVSENIRVRPLVDRYLEHARVFHFKAADRVFIASADWMPRNFTRRVEIMVPVESPALKARLVEILDLSASDDAKSWEMNTDGTYERSPRGENPMRSQQRFVDLARDKARTSELELPRASTRFPWRRA